MRKRPDSKAGRLRAVDRLIRGLLRTPKSRAGLIAAVAGSGLSRNFIYGWLSERRRDGTVTVLKGSGTQILYQITTHVVIETPSPSVYPPWLEPKTIPMANTRRVYIDGQVNAENKSKKGTT